MKMCVGMKGNTPRKNKTHKFKSKMKKKKLHTFDRHKTLILAETPKQKKEKRCKHTISGPLYQNQSKKRKKKQHRD